MLISSKWNFTALLNKITESSPEWDIRALPPLLCLHVNLPTVAMVSSSSRLYIRLFAAASAGQPALLFPSLRELSPLDAALALRAAIC